VKVAAICTTRNATAAEAAVRFDIPRAFDDVETMLATADIDVVDVCVNVTSHHHLVTLALSAEKHVFCEWPLGATLAESEDLRDRAVAAGVKHMIGLQARSAPVYDYMRQLVADGYVGHVLSCTINGSMSMEPSPRSESLPLIHVGHCLDTLLTVMDEELEQGSSIVSIEPMANHVLVHGRSTGGSLVQVNIRHVPVFASGFSFEVNGTDGTLVASIDGATLPAKGIRSLGEQINQATLQGVRKREQMTNMPVPHTHRWVPDDVPSGPPLSVAQTWRRFAESIRIGTRVEPDFDLAVKRHELFELMQHNSEVDATRMARSAESP
jgi:predicted dehydrogenase